MSGQSVTPSSIIQRTDPTQKYAEDVPADKSKGSFNRFQWEWLNKVLELSIPYNGEQSYKYRVGIDIRKLEDSGLAWCSLCSSTIAYGGRGWTAIKDHVLSCKTPSSHFNRVKHRVTHVQLNTERQPSSRFVQCYST